jgi:hypothetical protein
MSALESHYRRLMHAYPPAYRQAHGEEIIGTLLQASADRRLPSPREAAGLVGGGITARMRAATGHPVSWWADGLHLGILLIALANLALNLAYIHPAPSNASVPWVIGYLVLSVALVRGWLWVAWAAAHVHAPMASAVQPAIVLFLLSTGIWATAAARDLRWLLAAAIVVPATIGPDAILTQVYPMSAMNSTAAIVFWGVEVALVLVIGLTAQRTRGSRT